MFTKEGAFPQVMKKSFLVPQEMSEVRSQLKNWESERGKLKMAGKSTATASRQISKYKRKLKELGAGYERAKKKRDAMKAKGYAAKLIYEPVKLPTEKAGKKPTGALQKEVKQEMKEELAELKQKQQRERKRRLKAKAVGKPYKPRKKVAKKKKKAKKRIRRKPVAKKRKKKVTKKRKVAKKKRKVTRKKRKVAKKKRKVTRKKRKVAKKRRKPTKKRKVRRKKRKVAKKAKKRRTKRKVVKKAKRRKKVVRVGGKYGAAYVRKGKTYIRVNPKRKRKRKSYKRRSNPMKVMDMFKPKNLFSEKGYGWTALEGAGLLTGGAIYGQANRIASRVPWVRNAVQSIPFIGPVVAPAILPLLMGSIMNYLGKKQKIKAVEVIGRGLVGSAIVGIGVNTGEMVPFLASSPAIAGYSQQLGGYDQQLGKYDAHQLGEYKESPADFGGVDYTPEMSGVDYTPEGEADFGGVDYSPEGEADFGITPEGLV
jgi:hypothetical protein